LACLLAAAGLAGTPKGAPAHWERAEQVIAEIGASPLRETFGIAEVTRHPTLPRLLLIRVGPRWVEVAPSKRRAAAEQWAARWRNAVPQGVVAILDATTDRPLVNFDAEGGAVLKGPPDVSSGSSPAPTGH
jgi:hypothetical protein